MSTVLIAICTHISKFIIKKRQESMFRGLPGVDRSIKKKTPPLYFRAAWHFTTKLFFKKHSKLLSRSTNSTLPLTALVSERGVWSKIADNEASKVQSTV